MRIKQKQRKQQQRNQLNDMANGNLATAITAEVGHLIPEVREPKVIFQEKKSVRKYLLLRIN